MMLSQNPATGPIERIDNLDYLRGIAAAGIMGYHYCSWSFGTFDAATIWGKIGVYGVSIFYILSGLTLYLVYFNRMNPKWKEIGSFFKKRVFRIFPLLWVVTIAAILWYNKKPDFIDLTLNLTGLFGFFKWDKYFSAGVWSIGNELVFYALFPLLVYLTKRSKILMEALTCILTIIFIWFSFFGLDATITLADQWRTYTNPLNQALLFLIGFGMGHFLSDRDVLTPISFLSLATGVMLFIFFPVQEGDAINLVTGYVRLVMTLACILICIGFYKSKFSLPKFISMPLSTLGEISYSVYLLHPLIFGVLRYLSKKMVGWGEIQIPTIGLLLVSMAVTVFSSWLVFRYFEKPFINLAKRI